MASRHCSQSLPPCAYSPPLRQANKEHDGRPQDHDELQSARRGRSSPRVRLGGNAVGALRASAMHMFPRATRRRPCRLAVLARRSFRNPLNTDVMKAGSYICSVRAKPAADGLPQAAIPAASDHPEAPGRAPALAPPTLAPTPPTPPRPKGRRRARPVWPRSPDAAHVKAAGDGSRGALSAACTMWRRGSVVFAEPVHFHLC